MERKLHQLGVGAVEGLFGPRVDCKDTEIATLEALCGSTFCAVLDRVSTSGPVATSGAAAGCDKLSGMVFSVLLQRNKNRMTFTVHDL
jgi:hypothetical protein